MKDANALVRGSWGAAPVDGLEPQDGDHVVEKMRMNGFYETRLDILLRGLGVSGKGDDARGDQDDQVALAPILVTEEGHGYWTRWIVR